MSFETPCGVARKTRSQPSAIALTLGGTNFSFVFPLRFGWTMWTNSPANREEVTSSISASGWDRRSLRSSPPA